MDITTLGIDLAKNLFRVHGIDAKGRMVVARQLRRRQLLPFMARLQPCLVGRSGAGRAARSRTVVIIQLRRLTPLSSAARISRATRLHPTLMPSSLSSA